jgi:hypothetical protein
MRSTQSIDILVKHANMEVELLSQINLKARKMEKKFSVFGGTCSKFLHLNCNN